MEKESCLGVPEDNSYSSPLPAIGVYITASTLVCLLLMICDVLQGYRHRKPWFPCKFFSLNSLTLTLLGIATNLSVDLTTSMPSGRDQLSKLCGTLLMSVSMGFFTPSLADMEGLELFGNMASLTILVVTVIVNMCIQMSTGVIFSSFFVEHVISLILLLLTLLIMWYVALMKKWLLGLLNYHLWKGDKKPTTLGMRRAVQCNYELSYLTNPQLAVCAFKYGVIAWAAIFCIVSLVVIFQVCFRIFFLQHFQFCEAESDYKWSVWMVVMAQILTLVVGSLAIICRALFFASRYILYQDISPVEILEIQGFEVFARITSNWNIHYLQLNSTGRGIKKMLQALEELVIYLLFVTHTLMAWTGNAVMISTFSARYVFSSTVRNTSEVTSLSEYVEWKARKHVERWIEKCRKDHPHNLIQLMSSTQPSQESHLRQGSNNYLLLVFLLRMAIISIPTDHSESLVHALDEAFEILDFIDMQMAPLVSGNYLDRMVAKDLWISRDLGDHWFQKKFINSLQKKHTQVIKSTMDAGFLEKSCLDHAVGVMDEFTKSLQKFPILEIEKETTLLRMIIDMGPNDSLREVTDRMKQLFVDILYFFLPQLPNIILVYLSQSPAPARENRTRIALKFMCKFELLMAHVQWLSTECSSPPVEESHSIPPSFFCTLDDPPRGTEEDDGSIQVDDADSDSVAEDVDESIKADDAHSGAEDVYEIIEIILDDI